MLLRKITVLLAALSMMVVMSVPALAAGKADPNPKCYETGVQVGCNGHQGDDNLDNDEGGGNNHIKHNSGKGND